MQLRECEYILAIAQHGNMGKAAQELYVSQPTLSKMLTKLEDSIGAPLFERQSSGMVLTPVGEVYIQGAQRMLEMNAQLEQELKNISGKQPMLELGMPNLRTEMMTRSIFPALSKRFPGMMANYIHTWQSKLAVDLINNRCNLGVGIVTDKYRHYLNCAKVGEEEYVLAVPKGHPLERKAQAQPGRRYPLIATQHLRDVPFVLSRPDAFSTRFANRFFETNGISPPVALVLWSTRDVIHSVMAGAGVALLPSLPLGALDARDRIKYLGIHQEEEPMEVGVMYRRGYTLSPIEGAFIDMLRKAYQPD